MEAKTVNYRQMYKFALDKLGIKETNRRYTDLVKVAINDAYAQMYKHAGEVLDMEVEELENGIIYLPNNINHIVSVYHSKKKTVPRTQYRIYNDKITLTRDWKLLSGESFTVRYIENPKPLTEDKDVPNLPVDVHVGLVYYAMFMVNDNFQYLARFRDFIEEMKDTFPKVDEGSDEEIIVYNKGTIERDDDLVIIS